jgi:hypothetical protein
VLKDFLPRYNQRFAIPPAEAGAAFCKLQEGLDLDGVLCFKYERTVGTDNVVRLGEHRLQIMPTNGRASYARARVEVQERLDGSLAVYYQGHCLATKPAPPEAPLLRARHMARVVPNTSGAGIAPQASVKEKTLNIPPIHSGKPGPNHPWRRPFKVHIDRG